MKGGPLIIGGALLISAAFAKAETIRTVGKGTVACSDYTAIRLVLHQLGPWAAASGSAIQRLGPP